MAANKSSKQNDLAEFSPEQLIGVSRVEAKREFLRKMNEDASKYGSSMYDISTGYSTCVGIQCKSCTNMVCCCDASNCIQLRSFSCDEHFSASIRRKIPLYQFCESCTQSCTPFCSICETNMGG